MATTNFSVISKSKALEESIRIIIPPGRDLSSRRILALVESYCINPECTCETADIEVLQVSAPEHGTVIPGQKTGIEETEYKTDVSSAPVRLEVKLTDGTVTFPKDYQANYLEKEILKQVSAGLTKAHLATLRRHYEEAKDWGNERYWKEADWSYLREGICVHWVEVFPRAKEWMFKYKNTDYLAGDSYCIAPLCDCRDAIIDIYGIPSPSLYRRLLAAIARLFGRNSPPMKLSASTLGAVKYNIKTGRLTVAEVEYGRPGQLLRLADALFKTTKDLPSELRSHYKFMRDFGRHVVEQKRLKAAPIRIPSAPGRNAPCSCGSGRKYKKCCMGGKTAEYRQKSKPIAGK